MTRSLRHAAVALAGMFALVVTPTAQTPKPTVEQVLAKAAEYQAGYVLQISGVSLEERYQLMDVSGGRKNSVTRIESDVVLVNVNGQAFSLRDSYAIDTRPLRERTPRIAKLLGAPATPTRRDWELASRYPQDATVHFMLDLVVKLNEPTLALQFVSATYQPNFKYRLDGQKKINETQVVGVRFDEPAKQNHTYVLGTRGNGRATGRLWIDPLTGAVHQTELWVDSKTENAIISVKYARHPELGILLPSETSETYEEREGGGGPRDIGGSAMNSNSVATRFSAQARATYSNATLTPIDLTKIR